MKSILFLALVVSFLNTPATAWEVSGEQLSKIEKPAKKQIPIEDLMPDPPAMVTAKPFELMAPEEKLSASLEAFRHLQSAKVSCQTLDAWLTDSTKAMMAATAWMVIKRKLNESGKKTPKYFTRAGLALISAAALANIWSWLGNSERAMTVEYWLGRYHRWTGVSSGDGRASYYSSNDQAYAEFLALRDEGDVRELMTKNPRLMTLTLNYSELVRQAGKECRVIDKMNPSPLFDDAEEITEDPTSRARL